MSPRHARAFAVAAVVAVAGCHDPVTEIVLVVDSDLAVPGDVTRLELVIDSASTSVRQEFDLGPRGAGAFPATVGLLPGDAAGFGPIVLTVSLIKDQNPGLAPPVVSRKVENVRFVRGAVRMLYLALPRACACQDTSCPNALAPACLDVTTPTLAPFDPSHLPHLPASDGGATGGNDSGGGGASGTGGGAGGVSGAGGATPDAATDGALDAPAEHPSDARRDVASTDATDAAKEAPPAKLPRGHACGPGDVCADGFCTDGLCCQSACPCGTCTSIPGYCVLAPAGTDPRGECGDYTCNGGGACETSCAETFGTCSTHCRAGAFCDGTGKCTPSTSEADSFCVAGSCMCKPPLTCPAPDGGGAGKCQ